MPKYWIVNLVDRRIEVHTGPTESGYRTVAVCERGRTIRLLRFADVEVRVSDVLR